MEWGNVDGIGGRLKKIGLSSVGESLPLADPSRGRLKFSHPSALSELSGHEVVQLFVPGSSFGIFSLDDDPAAGALASDVALSCAMEGATVLHVSELSGIQGKLGKRVYAHVTKRLIDVGEENPLTRAEAKRLDDLEYCCLGLAGMEPSLRQEAIASAMRTCDPDLVVVEQAGKEVMGWCLDAAARDGVPVIYTGNAKRLEPDVVALETASEAKAVPTHILLMDRSLTEDEAELPDRPQWGLRECRLLIPDPEAPVLHLPFLGTFVVSFDPDAYGVWDVYDEYGGHWLWGEVESVLIDRALYPIIEPEHYGRKLELLYGSHESERD